MEQKSNKPVRLSSVLKKEYLISRDSDLGKLPPQALDLEGAVLGAIMLQKNAIIEVAGFLRAEHFYSEANKTIYEAISLLFSAGAPIDMKTVYHGLRETGKDELVGGAGYISDVCDRVSTAANIEYHARVLVEYAMKRSMIQLANEMNQAGYDDTIDVFSLVDKTNLQLQEILDSAIASKSDRTMLEIALKVLNEVQARQSGVHSGIDSGYTALDAILNGFQPTDLIIIAARPGMGKTAFAMQAGKQIAARGIPVGMISLEMSANQLVERFAIADAEINSDEVKKGKMQEYDHKRFNESCGNISKLPLHIDDTPFMTIFELRARALRMATKFKIKVLIIDYLQLVKGSGRAGQNRDQEIGEITRTLKGIAKELEIPVIALSQLSRGLETRGGTKRPQLSDLRESGNIEQDADIVTFLYRPEYYKIQVDDEGYPTHGLCEVIIAKHRNGSLDTVKMKFIGKFTKFANWEQLGAGEGRPRDQSAYVAQHTKNVLPSEKTLDEFDEKDPFK